MRERIGCWAYLALAIGFFFVWAISTGFLRLPVPAINDALFVIGGVLFLVGGAYALIDGVVTWFQEHFPSKQRRARTTRQAAAANLTAERLGMRPVADTATIDRSFPFLGAIRRGPGGGWWAGLRHGLAVGAVFIWLVIVVILAVMALAGRLDLWTFALILGGSSVVLLGAAALLGDWVGWFRARSRTPENAGQFNAGALRPGRGPIKALFAGRWNDLDVRVFDYASGDETKWTCAIVPLDAAVPNIEVRRLSATTRLARAIGRGELALDDEDFNKAFRVLADAEVDARRVLNATVRARIAADAPYQFLLQLRGREMLYCTPRVDIDSRSALLQAAKRLREALAPR